MKRFSPANLTAIRERRGLKPRHLAARLDIDDGSIRRYESGQTEPGANRVGELAHALDVEVSALYEDVDLSAVDLVDAELDAARRSQRSPRLGHGPRRREER